MKTLLHVALGLALITQVGEVHAAKKEPLRLKPSGSWHVDYAEKRCRLARSFGKDEQKVTALFDKYGPGAGFRLTLAGAPMRVKSADGDAWLQFGPTEEKQKVSFYVAKLGEKSALILGTAVNIAGSDPEKQKATEKTSNKDTTETPPIDPARLAAVRFIDIGKPLRNSIILETGPLRAPFAEMDKCIDSLMADWGIDVEKHKGLTRAAAPASDYQKWILPSDYPTDMLSIGQPALVEFRIGVAADGKPIDCHIQETTRPKEFDDAVCRALLRRAEFLPALDAEGKALLSFWRSRVRFQPSR